MKGKKVYTIFFICLITLMSVLAGCKGNETTSSSTENSNISSKKEMPEKVEKIKVATVSNTITFLPFYVAQEKGFFKKYNLDVELTSIEGGVVALRGLQIGDLQFMAGLPESIITSVSEGSNIQIIGTLSDKTLYSVFVRPEIKKVEDLKGKAVAVLQPGNGVDITMRWWLKQHGLKPDKDVRVVSAGGTPSRVAALKNNQVQATILQPPNDLDGEKAGMKRFAVLSEELTSYNHSVISTNGDIIKKQPEVVRAFMAATADAIEFIKDPANREEAIEIGMKSFETDKETTSKSLDFVIDSIPSKGKLNVEGIEWAIEAVEEVGSIKNKVHVDDVINESFYAK
ncbi:ABC transporter substrate-binding protein [Niallia endozanthoxylica]|uniref:ABC transporter substrate-binding protein n=1 Tax=Niallia endozanthoxylica TaxID=2036016 RepID=A0A5J5HP09_9BACI|nr:ABC transporter substrate-binding protein [Niallia endozanthoxylica]KAA9022248.1 ABC transporter substrate-binding protein [Niallia endozanthoxylica]